MGAALQNRGVNQEGQGWLSVRAHADFMKETMADAMLLITLVINGAVIPGGATLK